MASAILNCSADYPPFFAHGCPQNFQYGVLVVTDCIPGVHYCGDPAATPHALFLLSIAIRTFRVHDNWQPEDDIGGDRSTMDLDDLEDADAKSVGNSSSKSGGNFRDDLDSDEDDDGDGSIARLFSIEGLKRRRSDGESQLEAAKNDQAESVSQER